MTVTGVQKNYETKTMTISNEFGADLKRVWQLWGEPRQLERWWGPPTYPATFVDHDITSGGHVSYFMTGPDGDQPHGWWRVLAADPPHSLTVEDGFADDAGNPNPELPVMTIGVTLGRTSLRRNTDVSGDYISLSRGYGPDPVNGDGRGHDRGAVTDRPDRLSKASLRPRPMFCTATTSIL
jgi:uncharacterized protein YndB with AHSA1/START domain